MNLLKVLIGMNIAFFVLSALSPGFVDEFALHASRVSAEPWTLLTYMFLHANVYHLFFNMFALYSLGSYLLELVGERRFLGVYLLGGLAGGVFAMLLSAGPMMLVGASGAVFAVAGALSVMRPDTRVYVFPLPVALPLYVAVVGLLVVSAFLPNVSWEGHLGGLLAGVLMGYTRTRKEKTEIVVRYTSR